MMKEIFISSNYRKEEGRRKNSGGEVLKSEEGLREHKNSGGEGLKSEEGLREHKKGELRKHKRQGPGGQFGLNGYSSVKHCKAKSPMPAIYSSTDIRKKESNDISTSTDCRATSVIIEELTKICRQRKGENYLPNLRRMENKSSSCELCSRGTCLGKCCLGLYIKPSITRQVVSISDPSSIIPGFMGDQSSSLMEITKTPTTDMSKVPQSDTLSKMFRNGATSENKQEKSQSVGFVKEPVHDNKKEMVVGGPALNYNPVMLRKVLLNSNLRSSKTKGLKLEAKSIVKPKQKTSIERKLETAEISCSRRGTLKLPTPVEPEPSSSVYGHTQASLIPRRHPTWGHIMGGLLGGSPPVISRPSVAPSELTTDNLEIPEHINKIEEMDTLSFHSDSDSEESMVGLEKSEDIDENHFEEEFKEDLFDNQSVGVSADPVHNFEDVQKLSFYSTSSEEENSSDSNESDLFLSCHIEPPYLQVAGENSKSDVYNFSESDDDEIINQYIPTARVKFLQPKPIEIFCPNSECSGGATENSKEAIKKFLENKSKVDVKNDLLQHLKSQQRAGLLVSCMAFNGQFFCPQCFVRESGLSIYTVKLLFSDFQQGRYDYKHGNNGVVKHSAATVNFIAWFKIFLSTYGQEAPDESIVVLPSFLSIKDLFEIYLSEAEKPYLHISSFYQHYHEYFGQKRKDKKLPCVRISSYSSHSRCDQCVALVQLQRNSNTEEEQGLARSLRLKHRECYSGSRDYVVSLRHLSIRHPDSRLLIQLDDMDNSKSFIPRILEPGKKTSTIFKLPSKITGTIMHSSHYPQNRKINFYINHNNFEQSSNKVVSILFLLLKDFITDNKKLPSILHINADNCFRENKNKYVMAFLAVLVELGVFKEVTMEFLMVGHTGNECDQLFSILTDEFKSEIQTVENLVSKIEKAPIHPQPKVHRLFYTWDFKMFVEPLFSSTVIQNHTSYNSFQIKSEQGLVKLRAKKYPQYSEWYPHEGLKLLKDGFELTPIKPSLFREEELNIDKVLSDLRKYYIPTLKENEKRRVSDSWEKLSDTLRQLPKRNLPSMKILDLPRQLPDLPLTIPDNLSKHDDHADPPELLGERHVPFVEESNFQQDVDVGMDVAIRSISKAKRPWVGRVSSIISPENFEIQWFQRKSRNRTFFAMMNSDGSPYTSICSFQCVMFWEMSTNKTANSFDLSEYWIKRISHEYDLHDECS